MSYFVLYLYTFRFQSAYKSFLLLTFYKVFHIFFKLGLYVNIVLGCNSIWYVCVLWFIVDWPNPSSIFQQWWQRKDDDQSHPDRLLSPLPPVPSGISSLLSMCAYESVSVMSIRLFVFLHVCLSLHLLQGGCGPVCVVCFNTSATCGNLSMWSWNMFSCLCLSSFAPPLFLSPFLSEL